MSATVTRKRAIRRLLWEHRQTHPCILCPESDPACLDFHHLRDKQFSFNRASRWPIEFVHAEIAKCVILCSNCHRKLHAGKISLDSLGPQQIASKLAGRDDSVPEGIRWLHYLKQVAGREGGVPQERGDRGDASRWYDRPDASTLPCH